MIRACACDGHRGHGEGGCGWRSSGLREADGDACPLCGGVLVEATVPAPPVPQRPVAGWVETVARGSAYDDGHTHTLTERTLRDSSGRRIAKVATFARKSASWIVYGAAGDAPTLEAAQLAAEDALLVVLTDAARVLGKRVVS